MRFKKAAAAVAATLIAASAAAVSASAELIVVDNVKGDNGLDIFMSDKGSWMPIGYSNGEKDGTTKDVVDYGVDWSKAATIEVIFKVDDENSDYDIEEWDGSFGGAIVLSSQAPGNTTHNWNAKAFWGVDETDELEFNTIDDSRDIILETLGNYTYKAVCPIDDTNSVVEGASLVQICIQDWSGVTWWAMKVDSMTVKDASGAALISWDSNGKCSLSPVKADSSVDSTIDEIMEGYENLEEGMLGTAAPDSSAAETATTTAAPTAGDTTAATNSSKGSPNTGIADVAAIAGIAVVAGGAVVLSKKRK